MIDDLDIEVSEFGVELVQILGRKAIRLHVIDIVIGDVTIFVRQMKERLDHLCKVHCRRGATRAMRTRPRSGCR